MKLTRYTFALSLAAAASTLAVVPASAGGPDGFSVVVQVHDGHHHWPSRHYHAIRPVTGPEIYYSYHYDQIPGYPVPIFPSVRPPVVVQPVARYVSSPHIAWCHARYRSYRAYDNSFQPYHGGRRQCWSPYS